MPFRFLHHRHGLHRIDDGLVVAVDVDVMRIPSQRLKEGKRLGAVTGIPFPWNSASGVALVPWRDEGGPSRGGEPLGVGSFDGAVYINAGVVGFGAEVKVNVWFVERFHRVFMPFGAFDQCGVV